jgi:hypothetical protein
LKRTAQQRAKKNTAKQASAHDARGPGHLLQLSGFTVEGNCSDKQLQLKTIETFNYATARRCVAAATLFS